MLSMGLELYQNVGNCDFKKDDITICFFCQLLRKLPLHMFILLPDKFVCLNSGHAAPLAETL